MTENNCICKVLPFAILDKGNALFPSPSKSVATRFKTGLPAIKCRHVGVIYRAADGLVVIIFGCYLN